MWWMVLACQSTTAVDGDGDGWFSNVDCDDRNPSINPSMDEVPGDGVNNDCDLATRDDDYDQDGLVPPADCDDSDPNVPGIEVPYDGIDNDCSTLTPDDDLDRDGVDGEADCDDNDPGRSPLLTEVLYDGIDNDCDPSTVDDDEDGDGWAAAEDCDDHNASVQGETAWYADCDGDGYAALGAASIFTCEPVAAACGGSGAWTSIAPTGTPSTPTNDRIDCADLDARAYPGQVDWFGLPISAVALSYDYDCDGVVQPEYGLFECERVGQTAFCVFDGGFLAELECGELGDFASNCEATNDACVEDLVTEERLRCR